MSGCIKRKLGQIDVKVWTPGGGRWFEKTTRNLTPAEYAEHIHEMRERLGRFANAYVPNAFAGLCGDGE